MTPLLLGRLVLDAAQLWREHPPRIHHAKKKALFALAGGESRVPRGRLDVSRWAPGEIGRLGGRGRVESIDGPYTYPRSAAETWHVNFADTELFAFYGGPAFAQDELQVAEHPILASVRARLLAATEDGLKALTREADRPTPVLVRAAERWCAIDTEPELAMPYGIYGRRLQRASDEALAQAVTRLDDAAATNILAIVAPQGHGRYTRAQIEDVVVTATTGFAAVRAESSARVRIHTGHWGTGAFGGDRVLMATAQVLAARIAGVDLAYHSLADDAADAFRKGAAIADGFEEGSTLAAIVDALDARSFRWGSSDGN